MTQARAHLNRLHHLLTDYGLYAVSLATLLAFGLLAGRIYLSRSPMYTFLVWNLFLAWMPYLFSLWMAHLHHRAPRRWWGLVIPGALWLAFFPNAPYILTDFLHLTERPPVPLWYDIGLLAAFAWAGLYLALYSLRHVQRLIQQHLGAAIGWGFSMGVLALSGLGMYMGRYLRWNSWDIVLHPRAVLTDVAVRLVNPMAYPRTLGVTVVFAAFLFVCYLSLLPALQRPSEASFGWPRPGE